MTNAKARVEEVQQAQGRVVLVLQVQSGELNSGDRLQSASGSELLVLGVGFAPVEAWSRGLRAAVVSVLAGELPRTGDILLVQPC